MDNKELIKKLEKEILDSKDMNARRDTGQIVRDRQIIDNQLVIMKALTALLKEKE